MESLSKYLIIFLLFSSIFCSDVIELTDKIFQEFVENHEFTIVTFFSRICPHCQAFEPIFDKAAAESIELGRPYSFVRVEVNEQYITGDQQNITQVPTIRLFIKGSPVKPDFVTETIPVLRFLDNYYRDLYFSIPLQNIDELRKKADPKNNLNIILVSDNKDEIEIFKITAGNYKTFKNINFYHTASKTGLRAFPDIEHTPSIILFKPFDEKKAIFTGTMQLENIKEFIEENRAPKVREFDEETIGKIFKVNGAKALILFHGKNNENLNEIKDNFEQVANMKKYPNTYYIRAEPNVGLGKRVATIIGIEELDTPCIVAIQRLKDIESYMFDKKEGFIKEKIVKFMDDWKNEKLTKMPKTEHIPENNSGAVKKIVGKTFRREVLDSLEDVLVLFCYPSNLDCRKFDPIYNKIALNLLGKIKFGIIDPSKNSVENIHFDIKKVPILYFYKKDAKNTPQKFEGEFTEQNIINFLQKQASEKLTIRTDL